MSGAVLIDLTDTVQSEVLTGIQRVAIEVSRRWLGAGGRPVTWGRDGRLHAVEEPVLERLFGSGGVVPAAGPLDEVRRLILPELAAEPWRLAHLARAINRGLDLRVIGFDLVPITSSDTVAGGMSSRFARYLGVLQGASRVAAISESAAREFSGWVRILRAAGIPGPEVRGIPLPDGAPPSLSGELLGSRGEIEVLVVGSHEPRKNHATVLYAAESLWRAGRRFALTFIGGNTWSSQEFSALVDRLRAAGRPIHLERASSDSELGAAYRRAAFSVFPSLHEGFGLPIVESLAHGTPVIVSRYGSMREAADAGGALLVDPRDPAELAGAMARLLDDADERARLAGEARRRPVRGWDEYAAQSWAFLAG